MWTPKFFTSPSLGLWPSNPEKPQVSATALSSYPDDIKSYLTLQPQIQNNARLKRHIFIYAIGFTVFETSFLFLAYYCLFSPIPLQKTPGDGQFQLLSIHNATAEETKSSVTAVSVVWHALAGLFITNIINTICSAEFMAQYLRYRSLRPRKTDRVSRITSGLIDQISHFLTFSASREYRLTFVIVVFIMTLGPLGSSTITTGSMFLASEMDFRVAYLPDMDPATIGSQAEIDLAPPAVFISRMETVYQQLSFGFDTASKNTLIPWPRDRLIELPEYSTLTYQSDIARYKHTCSWKKGSYRSAANSPLAGFDIYEMEGKLYYVKKALIPIYALPSIVPLTQISHSKHDVPTPSTVFAFLTNGRPIQPDSTPGLGTIDLTNVPSFPMPNSPFGALLNCDPQVSILPAEVTISRRSLLTANIIPGWGEPNSSVSLIGNFAYSAAARIIPEVFSATFSDSQAIYYPRILGVLALDTFLTNASSARQLPRHLTPFHPLPLDTICQKLDHLAQVLGKVYLMGYRANLLPGQIPAVALLASHQTATLRFPVTALLTSKPFLIALTIVDGLVVVVLLVLLWSVCQGRALYLFDLENLTEVLCQERGNPGNIDSGKLETTEI